MEFAVVTFTNVSGKPCSLTGYPGVSLLNGGSLLGQPAQRSGAAYGPVTLPIRGIAHANVRDYSTCNAPLSDQMRIYAPNQTASVDVPMRLRGCRVVVDPVTIGPG